MHLYTFAFNYLMGKITNVFSSSSTQNRGTVLNEINPNPLPPPPPPSRRSGQYDPRLSLPLKKHSPNDDLPPFFSQHSDENSLENRKSSTDSTGSRDSIGSRHNSDSENISNQNLPVPNISTPPVNKRQSLVNRKTMQRALYEHEMP